MTPSPRLAAANKRRRGLGTATPMGLQQAAANHNPCTRRGGPRGVLDILSNTIVYNRDAATLWKSPIRVCCERIIPCGKVCGNAVDKVCTDWLFTGYTQGYPQLPVEKVLHFFYTRGLPDWREDCTLPEPRAQPPNNQEDKK